MKDKKDKFKVYSNSNLPKKNQGQEEVSVELEIPHEDTVTGLFVTSPYFMDMMMSQDYFYYPVNVEAEESLMAPLLNLEVLHDFLDHTELFRKREKIPAAALIHVEAENEDGETQMLPIFEGMIQTEMMKFFHTVVAVMNPEAALEEDFEEVFQSLIEETAQSGYLDTVLNNIVEYMSDPEILEAILFSEEEE